MPKRIAKSGGSAVAGGFRAAVQVSAVPYGRLGHRVAVGHLQMQRHCTATRWVGRLDIHLWKRIRHHQQRIAESQLDVADASVVHQVRLALHRGVGTPLRTNRSRRASR